MLSVLQENPRCSLAHLTQLCSLSINCSSVHSREVRRFLMNSFEQLTLLTQLKVRCGLWPLQGICLDIDH